MITYESENHEIDYRKTETKSKYFTFVNLVGALGCNHLTIYGVTNAAKYDWENNTYKFRSDWFEDLMSALKEIVCNDGDYAQVGWIQFSRNQTELIPEVEEKLGAYILHEIVVPAGHSVNGKCDLFMIDLKRIRNGK